MIEAHVELTLRAAKVAAFAIRSIEGVRDVLGEPNGEVAGFHSALERLNTFYRPVEPRRRKPRRRLALRPPAPVPELPPPPPKVVVAMDEASELPPSAWDPEPRYEASRCQAMLMEIIRRAAHDWVLYRQHERPEFKQLADNAYTWLFEEEPGHPAWKARDRALFQLEDDGQWVVEVGVRKLTSFLSICEICNLDPESVRERTRQLTVESIMRTGRHVERRKSKSSMDSMSIETHCVVVDVDMDSLEAELERGPSDYGEYDSYGVDRSL